MKKELIKIAV